MAAMASSPLVETHLTSQAFITLSNVDQKNVDQTTIQVKGWATKHFQEGRPTVSGKRGSRFPSSKTCGQRNVSERSLRPASPTRDRAMATAKLTSGSSQPRGGGAGRGTPRRQSPGTISPAAPAGASTRPSWRPRAQWRSSQSDCHLYAGEPFGLERSERDSKARAVADARPATPHQASPPRSRFRTDLQPPLSFRQSFDS